jgi:hypothetical protein
MQFTLVPAPTRELTVYQVLDDLGERGCVWREIADTEANEPTVVNNIIIGEYERPLRVVAFNTDEGWARDVTSEVAARVLEQRTQGRMVGASARDFVERVTGRPMSVVV